MSILTFTAEKARLLISEHDVAYELCTILKLIKAAAIRDNSTFLLYNDEISSQTKKQLSDRGFTIRDTSYLCATATKFSEIHTNVKYIISW